MPAVQWHRRYDEHGDLAAVHLLRRCTKPGDEITWALACTPQQTRRLQRLRDRYRLAIHLYGRECEIGTFTMTITRMMMIP